MIYFSKTTNGFYTTEIHGSKMPTDVVEITEATHQSLLAGQTAGKRISGDANGNPVLVAVDGPSVQQQIDTLERSITPRRLREAVLTGDHTFITGVETQIVALRAQL